jgi:hypothetical protein
MNNLTTRSNVFGVWVTIGFFEVTDANAIPVKMGKEINDWPVVGGPIRFRYFGIIDRTHLQVWPTYDDNGIANVRAQSAVAAGSQTVTMIGSTGAPTGGITNKFTNTTWNPQVGAVVTFDPNTDNEETVQITAVAGNTFTATFTRSHGANCVIISRGNPGPWRNYDPRKDGEVVPYQANID